MKGKLLGVFGMILGVFLLANCVSATSISVNSVVYKDRIGNIISYPVNTGDQIWAEITVTNPNVFQDLRYPYFSWSQYNNPDAWVGCNAKEHTTSSWDWECILTVTPQMNTTTEVYLKTNTRSGDNAQLLLGTFDFRGMPILTDQNCIKKTLCRNYKRDCTEVCSRWKAEKILIDGKKTLTGNKICAGYRKVCTKTEECATYKIVRICSGSLF